MATDYQHNDESHLAQMRGHARTMFADAVAAADPRAAVVRTLHKQPNSSQIQSAAKPQSFQLQEFSAQSTGCSIRQGRDSHDRRGSRVCS